MTDRHLNAASEFHQVTLEDDEPGVYRSECPWCGWSAGPFAKQPEAVAAGYRHVLAVAGEYAAAEAGFTFGAVE